MKPGIVAMVLVTTTTGFFLACPQHLFSWLLLTTLAGTGLVAAGVAVLNNYLERHVDAQMKRTRNRPLPAGIIRPAVALSYGLVLVALGLMSLLWLVNLWATGIVLAAACLYVLIYTPLKRITPMNTTIGAIPGALPPLVGWAAAQNGLEPGAWILFLLLFAWQHPHFYAIAWIFRDDYAKAGFHMLSCTQDNGRRLGRATLAYCVVLIGLSLVPCIMRITGLYYGVGATLLSLWFLDAGIRFVRTLVIPAARCLFHRSLFYLPALLLLIVFDHYVSK
jgi:protoheme IX farnesyltransferase